MNDSQPFLKSVLYVANPFNKFNNDVADAAAEINSIIRIVASFPNPISFRIVHSITLSLAPKEPSD